MVDNPIKIKKEFKQMQSWRIDDKSKIIHNSRFITHGFTSQKERIKDAIERNKFLQTEPILQAASLHNFRPKEAYKSDHSRKSKLLQPISNERYKQTSSLSETRTSLPDVFQKTHFKAVVSLAMQVGCLKKGNNIKMKDMDYEDAISRVREANNLQSPIGNIGRVKIDDVKESEKKKLAKSLTNSKFKIDTEQRPEKLAEYILVACNVINQKNKKSNKASSTQSENWSEKRSPKGTDSKMFNTIQPVQNNDALIESDEITEQDSPDDSQPVA